MTAATAPLSSTAAGALSAFLRGVERRALVVAELQCGDAAREHAVAALAATSPAIAEASLNLNSADSPLNGSRKPSSWSVIAIEIGFLSGEAFSIIIHRSIFRKQICCFVYLRIK